MGYKLTFYKALVQTEIGVVQVAVWGHYEHARNMMNHPDSFCEECQRKNK